MGLYRTIELAHSIIASANHRHYMAMLHIQHNRGALERRISIGQVRMVPFKFQESFL
jgi:hypothetical protein